MIVMHGGKTPDVNEFAVPLNDLVILAHFLQDFYIRRPFTSDETTVGEWMAYNFGPLTTFLQTLDGTQAQDYVFEVVKDHRLDELHAITLMDLEPYRHPK